ncbi:MAG: hypothetical protein AVO38_16085 [delta proteobacterium ML8_D]|nr:MAG: hypothetical protein AVO38_16085 [delta proteobacterium ML8_D]
MASVIGARPIMIATISVAMPVENIWPSTRMVAAELEARPRYGFPTDPMIAFMFGSSLTVTNSFTC